MPTEDALREAERFFHQQIPLTRAMGVRVVRADGDKIAVEAPVAPNQNHLKTAFGGSIHAIATLAGYGCLWLALRDPKVHVVIAESSIRYLLPVRETIRGVCALPGQSQLDAFRAALAAKGKARICLDVTIEENEVVAAEFSGTFVALAT